MSLAPPVRYTDALEEVQPDEAEVIGKLNEDFDTILETTAKNYGHAVRSVHAKAHGILKGELTVDGDLPPELAQGLFATGGTYPVLMRVSTNAGDILDDAISLPRGLAWKVLGVEGERLPGAEGDTQDFVMVNGPIFQAKTAKEFEGNLKALAATTDKAEGAKKLLSATLRGVESVLEAVGAESAKIKTLGGQAQTHPLGETFFSATPFRYGDYVAKFQVAPVSPQLRRLEGTEVDLAGNPDGLRDTVRSDAQGLDGEWEVRVQLLRDIERQPVEDPTTEWKEEDSPFQRVGVIRTAPQDSWDDALVKKVNEETRFSIWTGLAAHRPLGNINRARKDTYEHSARFRERVNGCPIHEPAAG